MKKALIAMSGGVDSSVAALLTLKSGYECIGATMKLFNNENSVITSLKSCCSADDTSDARSVAGKIGIPYYVFNFTADFQEKVISNFIRSYENGLTPNPCIDCNKYLKFDKLFDKMNELGFDYVVTGHYARIIYDEKSERYLLKKAVDLSKDQSYVLYSLNQYQLSHTLFPLGDMTKKQTRETALENGFINAQKHESQDICFVPDGDYSAFIERYTGKKYNKGNFVDTHGRILGEHKGIIKYTVGQRRGLGLALPKPMYVCRIDVRKNEVVLGYNDDLMCREVIADNVNYISVSKINQPMRIKAKIRYNQPEQPGILYGMDNNIKVVFDEPQRAVTKGQALVVYDGDSVVCGGTII
jgi:tRNA-specific 2-thiouridylase